MRNLNGTVEVGRSTSDNVEVTATRHTQRGDPEYVRFEMKKFGPSSRTC